jgi:hypothetical protein
MQRLQILVITLWTLTTLGCQGKDEQQLRQWQQTQVDQLQRQAQENAAAAQELVTADARAREDLVALERDLQAERSENARQRDLLEDERKSLALERQRAPLITAAVHSAGIVLLCALPLVVCWLLLRALAKDADTNELEDLLILNLAQQSDLIPLSHQLGSLIVPKLEDDSHLARSDAADDYDEPSAGLT